MISITVDLPEATAAERAAYFASRTRQALLYVAGHETHEVRLVIRHEDAVCEAIQLTTEEADALFPYYRRDAGA
jgi:putative SOS response-associated peptidase YedK